MPKQEELYTEEPYTEEEPVEEFEIEEQRTAENANTAIAAADFDPERVLYDIKKALLGFEKRDNKYVRVSEPLARTEFIILYINSIRSLVNFHSMFSQTSPDEAAFSMLESLKEITYAAVDFGIAEEHLETLINMYDTLKNTFYGITINGRGTENIKQVLTSVYKDLTSTLSESNKNSNFINWDNVNNYIKK